MGTSTQPSDSPVKVLIAEDSPTQAQRLRHILEQQGYEVGVAANGRLVVLGLQGGSRAELDLGMLLRKRAAILATALRARPPDEKAAIVSSVVRYVWPQVASGALRPVIDRTLPIAEAGEAHRIVEAGENFGKVLLELPGARG